MWPEIYLPSNRPTIQTNIAMELEGDNCPPQIHILTPQAFAICTPNINPFTANLYIFIIENHTLSTTNYRYNISIKRNKVHWASMKCAVSNVQYRTFTYDHSQARKAIISSTCVVVRKFRS